MTSLFRIHILLFALAIMAYPGAAQSPSQSPLLQDIKVYSDTNSESTDFVRKTSSVTPSNAVHANSSIPALADIEIPGYTGILVQTMDGTNVVEIGSNITFNPASNVKIATAFAVLKTFWPDYRFPT